MSISSLLVGLIVPFLVILVIVFFVRRVLKNFSKDFSKDIGGQKMNAPGLFSQMFSKENRSLLHRAFEVGMGSSADWLSDEKKKILQTGNRAKARIVQLSHPGGGGASVNAARFLKLALILDVMKPDRDSYRVQITQMISELLIPSLQPGSVVDVRIDPTDPQKVVIAGPDQASTDIQ